MPITRQKIADTNEQTKLAWTKQVTTTGVDNKERITTTNKNKKAIPNEANIPIVQKFNRLENIYFYYIYFIYSFLD